MKTNKRKVILHRVQKTVVKNYTTPQETIIRDIHITIPQKEYNWFNTPITYPRWIILLITGLLVISLFI
jgi:hypothetical protein